MNVLLIYTEAEKDTAARLIPLVEGMGILTVILPLQSSGDSHIEQFTAFFEFHNKENSAGIPKSRRDPNFPSHILILSSLSRQWYDFFAGYHFGTQTPFLIYGIEAIPGISAEFASCFTFLKTMDSLQTYLEAENEAFKKQEAAREIIKAQETLLGMGVPVNGEALAQCAGDDRIREVSLFLAAGFSPDTRDRAGVPLLNIASRKGCAETVRFLVMAGAQLNLQADDRGTTALIDSVMGKHYDVMKDLIKAGIDTNLRSKDGQTALIVAVGSGEDKMVEALLKAGADPDISDSLGASARKYAVLFHRKSILALFENCAPEKAALPKAE
ncbi:MAG: ankyrin repeat domain-containing protein [Treponema sp.]|jgi:hypothetical protein|nr:ankyrin repeat domain-containing protein [Treponema sp.]